MKVLIVFTFIRISTITQDISRCLVLIIIERGTLKTLYKVLIIVEHFLQHFFLYRSRKPLLNYPRTRTTLIQDKIQPRT